jgi:hypothetical protein
MSDRRLNEYRCTRNRPYRCPGYPGHRDLTARQGHYVLAASPAAALSEMREDFPQDRIFGFTVDLVKERVGCSRCHDYNCFCTFKAVECRAP